MTTTHSSRRFRVLTLLLSALLAVGTLVPAAGLVGPPSALAYAAVKGMAESTEDSHTNFMTPEQYQEHLAWTRGDVSYGGIGARMRGPQATVLEVFGGSPAERAGLRPGDTIVGVDGR